MTVSRVVRAGVEVDLNGGLGVGSTVGPRVPWEMRCPATSFRYRCSFCYLPWGASANLLVCVWCGIQWKCGGRWWRLLQPPQVFVPRAHQGS